MTPAEIITDARVLINDTRPTYRTSDTSMLAFVNQAIKRAAVLRPDLFSYVGDITTVANSAVQSAPADCARIIELYSVKNGDVLEEVSKEKMDISYPGWMKETAGVPVNWMRNPRNGTKYFLYPRPATGTVLVGEYVQSPPAYGMEDTIQLIPEAYWPVIVDGTVFLAQSVDDEHVASGRAKLFLDSFTQGLGVSLQSRVVTDKEDGGVGR